MTKTLYRLYYWYGGFVDDHRREGTFESMEELLKSHKNKRNTPLYNYNVVDTYDPDVEEYTITVEPNKCIYTPVEEKEETENKITIYDFLANTYKRLQGEK